MRLLTLSVAGGLVVAVGAAWAQSSSGNSSGVTQLPVGQIYRDPKYPFFDALGQLKYTLTATELKGITINRAEATTLKIDLYDKGKVTTTITSPKADLYMEDRKMRTHDTVKIERADLEATAQLCDFDLLDKQYTLRNNVKVTLKHFDLNAPTAGRTGGTMGVSAPAARPPKSAPSPDASAAGKNDSLLESPGLFSSTNNAPLPQ